MSEIPEFLRDRGDQMFRDLVQALTPVELKQPATTPRVLRSPFVTPHYELVKRTPAVRAGEWMPVEQGEGS